jgi:hypothetical protein
VTGPSTSPAPGAVGSWLLWALAFLSFPVAGLVGLVPVDRVDSPLAALVGGAATGVVIGAAQWLVSRRRLRPLRWVLATSLGMGLGLLVGATAVDFGTSLGELALMGAITGVALGLAQALALPSGSSRRWWWAAAMPVLWSLGWVVTTLAGITVEEQFTIFGMSGGITFTALSGLLLYWILRARPAVAVQGHIANSPDPA